MQRWRCRRPPVGHPTSLDPVGTIGGVTAVDGAGTTAYVGEGPSVVVLNITDPARPVRVSQVVLLDLVTDLTVVGTPVGGMNATAPRLPVYWFSVLPTSRVVRMFVHPVPIWCVPPCAAAQTDAATAPR
jgi:hypothetical protein